MKALCAVCNTPMNKAQAVRDLPKIRDWFEIQQLTGEHILERVGPSVSSDSESTHESTG